jgi:hypothetical protein
MPYNFDQGVQDHDLSPRFKSSSTIVGSPGLAAEVVVCQVAGLDNFLGAASGVFLSGVISFTVGTSGTAIRLRIRQGTVAGAGTVVADTGALTGGVAATNLLSQDLQGFDATASGGAAIASTSYHLSLQVTAGAAVSTVSQTNLVALVV